MDREDITETAKKEFSSKVNQQRGEISSKIIKEPKFLSEKQKNSWFVRGSLAIAPNPVTNSRAKTQWILASSKVEVL